MRMVRCTRIKRFSLKVAASAIMTLNAETVIASCPSSITSNSGLAGIICDFDAGTGSSVTVENGGTVGGISMISYAPAPPSYITVDSGGLVSNSNAGDVGITINNSSLSNGLSNSGTISSAGSGIVISNTSTISGGISNSGLISSTNGSLAISGSNINGDIFNSGTISSTSGTSIRIFSSSTINGGISNSGTIQGGGVDVGITITDNSIIAGDITNSGLIYASGSGNGILMRSSSTISGGISNSGTIESAGNSGIVVLNASNIQGDFSNSGAIRGATEGLSIHNGSIVNGTLLNSGTISGGNNGISIYSATTISGSISNSGTISGGQNGISISSSATINGGISNSGTIQGDIGAINITADSSVSNIDILGQNARIIGAVEAPNTTVNLTSGATFSSEGSYHVNVFNISANAVFNMANTITAATVNNSGRLVTNTLQTIAGDYTQQTGGIFQTAVSSATDYGQLAVTGAVDLSQSGDLYVRIDQNTALHAGDILSNVISGNTFTSPTNGFTVSDNSYIWAFSPILNNSNNGINLTTTINPNAYDVCQGTYCQGAATAIIDQVAAGNSVFNSYALLPTESALQEAASQATPELTNENIQVIQLATRAVQDVIPMWNTLHGKSVWDTMLYPSRKIWIKPYGASMIQNKRNTVEGFNATVYGVVMGEDFSLMHDTLLGGALSVGGDNMRGKSVLSGQSINSNAYQAMLYGAQKFPNRLYFAGQGLVGYENNHTSRSIPLYATTANSSYNSWFTNFRAETGWNVDVFSPDFVFTPRVEANYLFINQGSYHESGSPMDLWVASNRNSSLILGAYGNGAYHLITNNQYNLTLTGYAGVASNVLNGQPHTIATFAAGGSSFSTFGVSFNGLVLRGGAGLALTSQINPLTVVLNYDLQVGNKAYSGIGAATIKYSI